MPAKPGPGTVGAAGVTTVGDRVVDRMPVTMRQKQRRRMRLKEALECWRLLRWLEHADRKPATS